MLYCKDRYVLWILRGLGGDLSPLIRSMKDIMLLDMKNYDLGLLEAFKPSYYLLIDVYFQTLYTPFQTSYNGLKEI